MKYALLMTLAAYAYVAAAEAARYPAWHDTHCRYGDEIRTNGTCHLDRSDVIIAAVMWPVLGVRQ